ncbi:ParB N-terminal domain-containing protein [Mesorhizobium sp. BE184]|uniref:ParB N-terminal domain-containing protein n=1 Tax=Mesorhizobium sp. BE184 TaxID=2817714 RepID=UPI00285EBCFE|nr:ParB N-terminal domain-containing protein [Mesorhizobium sp. BE184]MDR7034516.1 hypothetical protein [Mesorhizobium sp. BE184]
MTQIASIRVDLIDRRSDARPLDSATIDGLTQSIKVVGLINPIRVRPVGERYEIVSGHHRFGVCAFLDWAEIPCIVADDDDLHAELAMIDENLMRAELSASERAVQTARRKAIHLELHPETAQHVAGAHASNRLQGNASANFAPAFAAETAKATGQSERTVQLHVERGEKVIGAALDIIRGTKLDTGVYLDKLKRLSASDQITAAKRDVAWEKQKSAAAPPENSQGRVGDTASQVQPKAKPTYEQMRSAILLLADLTADDITSICPPTKRAAMCQKLAHLEQVFGQVREAAST